MAGWETVNRVFGRLVTWVLVAFGAAYLLLGFAGLIFYAVLAALAALLANL